MRGLKKAIKRLSELIYEIEANMNEDKTTEIKIELLYLKSYMKGLNDGLDSLWLVDRSVAKNDDLLFDTKTCQVAS